MRTSIARLLVPVQGLRRGPLGGQGKLFWLPRNHSRMRAKDLAWDRGRASMRYVSMALAAMMLLTAMPAYSANARKHSPQDNVQPEQKNDRVDDKAYKSALDKIPAADQKADPW